MRVSSPASTLSTARTPASPPAVGGEAWSLALAQPAFRWSWLVLLVFLFGGLVPVVPGFFQAMQQRSGTVLADPVLALLPRHDVAWPIFGLMYGSVVVAVGWLTRQPRLFLRGLWAYAISLVLRMATIWLVPLLPPLDILPLPDPFLAQIFHTVASEAITHDLFFSGHTATVAVLALAVRGWLRPVLLLAMVAVGTLVLVQRVHYTCDVLAAPLFAWLAYWVAGFIEPATAPGVAPIGAQAQA